MISSFKRQKIRVASKIRGFFASFSKIARLYSYIAIKDWLIKTDSEGSAFTLISAIQEYKQGHNSLTVYPNPNINQSVVTLQTEHQLPETTAVHIKTMLGQTIKVEEVHWECDEKGCLSKLPVTEWLPGTYIVEIKGEAENWIGKLIKL